jgi:hypothetical protein
MPGGPRPPLEVIASWPPANLVDPEGRGTVATPIAAILSPITFFVIFARLWVRFYLQRNAGWDDWFMVAAIVCLIVPFFHIKYLNSLLLNSPSSPHWLLLSHMVRVCNTRAVVCN